MPFPKCFLFLFADGVRLNAKRHRVAASVVLFMALANAGGASANGFTTPHQFAVTETGAATVQIPLQVPRGIGGMEPQLSLSYSSGSGNGLLGLGWTLTGPSAITRCAKNLIADGVRGTVTFALSDRYCLDGQRLEIESPAGNTDTVYGTQGTTYRTERDSFSRITATGGSYANAFGTQATVPNSFKVETKAGLVLEFGRDANSRVLTNRPGFSLGPNTINRWMLQRISDRTPAGSFVEFVYCSGEVTADGTTCNTTAWAGSTVLHYIRYTNRGGTLNGEMAVVFSYESRPDRIQVFHQGSPTRQTQRLTRITTYRNVAGSAAGSIQPGERIRSYVLSYDPLQAADGTSLRATNTSRLASVTERGQDDSQSLPPLTFALAPDTVFGMAVKQQANTSTARSVPLSAPNCGGVVDGIYRLCR